MATSYTTKVKVVPSDMASYATALRAHLSAALAYTRVNDYEAAETELNRVNICTDVICEQINHKIRERKSNEYDRNN